MHFYLEPPPPHEPFEIMSGLIKINYAQCTSYYIVLTDIEGPKSIKAIGTLITIQDHNRYMTILFAC